MTYDWCIFLLYQKTKAIRKRRPSKAQFFFLGPESSSLFLVFSAHTPTTQTEPTATDHQGHTNSTESSFPQFDITKPNAQDQAVVVSSIFCEIKPGVRSTMLEDNLNELVSKPLNSAAKLVAKRWFLIVFFLRKVKIFVTNNVVIYARLRERSVLWMNCNV